MKKLVYSSLILALVALLSFSACKNEGAKTGGDNAAAVENPEAIPPVKGEIQIFPFPFSLDFPGAGLTSLDYKNGKFTAKIAGDNFILGEQTGDRDQKMCANSKEGQHLHLIVDDSAYVAKYKAEFEHKIADGDHFICSFLSRSYHESIKTKEAGWIRKVTVKNGSFTKVTPVKEPMIFYSRPKGKYVGKAETTKVMLDFYLNNTTLAPNGFRVKALFNNEKEYVIDTWQPYYIENLPLGDNKVKLTLIDPAGNPVACPLNPVERVFTLEADPLEK